SLGRFFVSSVSITGTVSEIRTDEREIQIGEEVYSYRSGLDVEDVLGREVTAKLNYLGQVSDLDFDVAASGQYGAIVAMQIDGGLGQDLRARVVLPGKIVDEEEEESDDPSEQAVPMIEAQNSAIEEFTFASKVIFDGVSYGDAAELEAAIR